jgi:hypothetical protein
MKTNKSREREGERERKKILGASLLGYETRDMPTVFSVEILKKMTTWKTRA